LFLRFALLADRFFWPVTVALAAGVVALGRRIAAHNFDVNLGVEAFGVATFAGEHFVAFHNSSESTQLRIETHL
jgi:hypothetical protein